jgi:hypothetical protein
MKRVLVTFAAAFAFVIACSGESKQGEECDEVGKTEDVCESGSVCGKQTGGAVICLKQCADDSNCASTEACNGVEGTNIKGCRLKDTSGTASGSSSGGTTDADGGKK